MYDIVNNRLFDVDFKLEDRQGTVSSCFAVLFPKERKEKIIQVIKIIKLPKNYLTSMIKKLESVCQISLPRISNRSRNSLLIKVD